MKKQLKLIYLLAIGLILSILSCNNDDEGATSSPINLQDLQVTIDENPTNGQIIGTVQTDGNGAIDFDIATQTPAGALSINSTSGELTIADATLFDFETNPEITATISANNVVNTANITINLNNLNEAAVPGGTDTEFVIGTDAYVTPKAYLLLDDAAGGFEREFSFVFTNGDVVEDATNGIAFETTMTTHFSKITCNLIGMSMTEAQLPIFTWPVQNPAVSIVMEGNNYTHIDITAFNNPSMVGGLSFGQVDTSTNYPHLGQALGSLNHPTHLLTVNSITVDLTAGTGTIDCSYNYDDDNGINISGVFVGSYEILTAF